MQIVKDFWATPEYAELLIQMNDRLHPYIVGGEGTPRKPSTAWRPTGRRRSRSYNRYQ
jgi:multiple sugar transport system substrate-binding protein